MNTEYDERVLCEACRDRFDRDDAIETDCGWYCQRCARHAGKDLWNAAYELRRETARLAQKLGEAERSIREYQRLLANVKTAQQSMRVAAWSNAEDVRADIRCWADGFSQGRAGAFRQAAEWIDASL